jgi:hypothetical protein
MTGQGPSFRANARDLRRFLALLETRISPGVYPETCRRGRNDKESFFACLASWRNIAWDGLIAGMLHGSESERTPSVSTGLLLDVDPSNFLKHRSLVAGL